MIRVIAVVLLVLVSGRIFGSSIEVHKQRTSRGTWVTSRIALRTKVHDARIGYVLNMAFKKPAGISCDDFEALLDKEFESDWGQYPMDFMLEYDGCEYSGPESTVSLFVSEYGSAMSEKFQQYLETHQGRQVLNRKLAFWKEEGYLFPGVFRLEYEFLCKGRGCLQSLAYATQWVTTTDYSKAREMRILGKQIVDLTSRKEFLAAVERTYSAEKAKAFEDQIPKANSMSYYVWPVHLIEDGRSIRYPIGLGSYRVCESVGTCFKD